MVKQKLYINSVLGLWFGNKRSRRGTGIKKIVVTLVSHRLKLFPAVYVYMMAKKHSGVDRKNSKLQT